jgi:hypothetical protein
MARTRSQLNKTKSKHTPDIKSTSEKTPLTSTNRAEPVLETEGESVPEPEPNPEPEPSSRPESLASRPEEEDRGTSNHEILPSADEIDEIDETDEIDKTDEIVDGKSTRGRGRVEGSTNWAMWEKKAVAQEVRNQELWKFPARSKEAQERWSKIPDLICVKHPKFARTVAATKTHFSHRMLKEWVSKTL